MSNCDHLLNWWPSLPCNHLLVMCYQYIHTIIIWTCCWFHWHTSKYKQYCVGRKSLGHWLIQEGWGHESSLCLNALVLDLLLCMAEWNQIISSTNKLLWWVLEIYDGGVWLSVSAVLAINQWDQTCEAQHHFRAVMDRSFYELVLFLVYLVNISESGYVTKTFNCRFHCHTFGAPSSMGKGAPAVLEEVQHFKCLRSIHNVKTHTNLIWDDGKINTGK